MGRRQGSPVQLASLTTAQRNALTAVEGDLTEHSTFHQPEFYNGTTWTQIPILGDATMVDANYTSNAYDRIVRTSVTLTAVRTVTLPAANALPAGTPFTVIDSFGAVNGTNLILVSAGSDSINVIAAINVQYGSITLVTNGSTKWTVAVLGASAGGTGAATAAGAADNILGTTTRGDIPFRGASAVGRLGKGSTGQILTQGANDPSWAANGYTVVGTDTTQTANTNPTALTSMLNATFTLANSSVATGDVFEIEASGSYTNSQNATTLRLQFLLGAVALMDYTSVSLNTSANPRRWYFRAFYTIGTTGASGGMRSSGILLISNAAAASVNPISISAVNGGAGGDIAVMAGNPTSIDFTNPGAFDMKVAVGTSSSTSSVTLRVFRINKFAA